MGLTKITYAMIDGAVVNVLDYGAVGDGVTDDTQAIQNASDYCTDNGLELYFPAGDYATTDTIIFEDCHVVGFGATIYPSNSVTTGVQVGTSLTIFEKSIRGLTVRGNGKDVQPSSSNAWLFVNAANALFEQIEGSRFDYGFSIIPPTSTRVAYCVWLNPFVHRCNRNFYIYVDTSGYAAENTVVGGRLQMSSTEEVEYHVYAYRSGTAGSMNHWKWLGTAMESSSVATTAKGAMRLLGADYWYILEPRTEGAWTESDIYFSASSQDNHVISTYTDGSFTVVDDGDDNIIDTKNTRTVQNGIPQIISRGTIATNIAADAGTLLAAQKDGTAKIQIASDGTSVPSYNCGSPSNPDLVQYGTVIATPSAFIRVNSVNTLECITTAVRPYTDSTLSLGTSTRKWTVVYADTGTINTSDEREKTELLTLSDAEKNCAIELKSNIKKYKFLNSIKNKGNGARIHFGIGAQTVKSVFEKHGLNADDYGLFCYDEWAEESEIVDKEGNVIRPYRPAGNRFGIRYDELLTFIISAV